MAAQTGQYTVVKFVPDSVRFEPINIGIVLEVGERVVTVMSESIDPRIRYADPYVDVRSLRDFLREFDPRSLVPAEKPVVRTLSAGNVPLANIFFDQSRTFDAEKLGVDEAADLLFGRLVRRTFAKPSGFVRPASPTAARTALRKAFMAARVLGKRVRSDVRTLGKSGVHWDVDFEYLTDQVVLVQTATTGLKEDLRRREHAFSAFAALVDTTTSPGVTGVLAIDEPADADELSGQLAAMAKAHGLDFVGGQRAFLTLARGVSENARTLPPAETPIEHEGPQVLLRI